MRTVFFGTPELAVPSLEAVSSRHEIAAVVCQPDRPKGRGKTLVAPPAKQWALARGVPVNQPSKLNDGTFESWLRAHAPEVCVLVAYGRILKQPVLDVPPHGFFNVHPSLLPKYRGPSPIQSALLDGLEETGVSVMRLDAGVDSGDVVAQSPLPVLPEDDAGSLTARAGELGASMLVDVLEGLEAGSLVYTRQDDAEATFTRMFTKKDGRIDWQWPARRIVNLVRASTPWPGAQCTLGSKAIRLLRVEAVDADCLTAPGVVVEAGKDCVRVATGAGLLEIVEMQVAGKRAMPVAEFLRGNAVKPGDRFGEV